MDMHRITILTLALRLMRKLSLQNGSENPTATSHYISPTPSASSHPAPPPNSLPALPLNSLPLLQLIVNTFARYQPTGNLFVNDSTSNKNLGNTQVAFKPTLYVNLYSPPGTIGSYECQRTFATLANPQITHLVPHGTTGHSIQDYFKVEREFSINSLTTFPRQETPAKINTDLQRIQEVCSTV